MTRHRTPRDRDPNTPPTPMETVGARIRALRMSHGMTQADLARRCYVHQVTVSCWERGTATPAWFGRPSRRDLIAEALGLPAAYIFREVIDAEAQQAPA